MKPILRGNARHTLPPYPNGSRIYSLQSQRSIFSLNVVFLNISGLSERLSSLTLSAVCIIVYCHFGLEECRIEVKSSSAIGWKRLLFMMAINVFKVCVCVYRRGLPATYTDCSTRKHIHYTTKHSPFECIMPLLCCCCCFDR